MDLRGHGKSDAPYQNYTMQGYVDDIAWLCKELHLVKPVLVGHSMGGNKALEVGAAYPEVPASIVMIDSLALPPQSTFLANHQAFIEAPRGPQYLDIYKQALSKMCLPSEKAASVCKLLAAYIFSIVPYLDLARLQSLMPQLISGHTLGAGHSLQSWCPSRSIQ